MHIKTFHLYSDNVKLLSLVFLSLNSNITFNFFLKTNVCVHLGNKFLQEIKKHAQILQTLMRPTLKTSSCLFVSASLLSFILWSSYQDVSFYKLFWLWWTFPDSCSPVEVSTRGQKPNTELCNWRFLRSSQWADSLSDGECRDEEPNNRTSLITAHKTVLFQGEAETIWRSEWTLSTWRLRSSTRHSSSSSGG